MSIKKLSAQVADETGMSKADVERVTQALFESIYNSTDRGEPVMIKGFGKFEMVERGPREANNPATGGKIQIPARRVFRFKPSSRLKAR